MVSGTTFPGRRSLPAAAERTDARRLDPQPAAPARRRQRLPHRRSARPVRSDARLQDGRRRLGRPVQVGRRRPELEEHAAAGFPQDVSPEGLSSPIKGREGATDPVVRAGTNGLFYYAGVAFDRGGNQPSSIFVARYMDLNNLEAGDPFGYVDTRLVDSDSGTRFLDKVALAVDIPRSAATCTITSRQSDDKPGIRRSHVRTIPAGNVYVAYAAFTGSGATEQSVIMISRSTNCGETWSTPIALSTGSRLVQNPQIAVSPADGAVYVSWRRFLYTSQDDAVMIVKSVNGGATFSKPLRVSGVRSVRSGDVGHAVPQQRVPDDGDRCHRARVPRVARPRLCGGAPRPGDRRLAHRHLDLDDRLDVVGASRDSAGGRRAPADAGDDLPRRQAARPVLRPARRRLGAVRPADRRGGDSHRPDAAHPSHDGRVRGAGRARAPRRRSPRRASRTTPAASCRDRPSSSGCSSTRPTCRCSARARCRSWAITSTSRRRRRSS